MVDSGKLGHIHTILQGVEAGPDGKSPVFANHIEPHNVLDRTQRGTRRIRGWASSPAELRLAEAAEALAHLVATVERDLVSALPRQLVHGDFWDNNVFFRDGGVVLVTDFNFMGVRARIDDLALTLYFTSLQYAENPVSDDQLLRLRRLVDAYDRSLAEPLSSAERAALPQARPASPCGPLAAGLPCSTTSRAPGDTPLGPLGQWTGRWALFANSTDGKQHSRRSP